VGRHCAKGAGGEGPPPRACEGAGGGVAHRGEEGEGKIEREREREREGELTSGSKSGDHRLQNLGHHGERERGGGEEVATRENQMREREIREGGAHGGGAGHRGRAGQSGPAGPGWVGLGRVAGQKPTTRTTIDQNPNRETRLSKTRD
jgi:hypothetical protein